MKRVVLTHDIGTTNDAKVRVLTQKDVLPVPWRKKADYKEAMQYI